MYDQPAVGPDYCCLSKAPEDDIVLSGDFEAVGGGDRAEVIGAVVEGGGCRWWG